MNYLVTGGSGFIGSHLIEELLKKGHFVISIDNFDNFYDYKIKIKNTLESVGLSPNFDFTNDKEKDIEILQSKLVDVALYEFYYQDIRDKKGLETIFQKYKIDMVIHLAALAGVRPSIERPMELWELCKDYGIKKFICASSSSVYGNNEKIPFAETDNVDRPISPYAATKKCGEILGHTYHHLYDIDMIQLRFFTVYGPRQRPDLAIHKFAKIISDGGEIPFYGDGTTARDYTFVEDIVDGITKSIVYLENHNKVYEVLNLGENQVVSLKEMLVEIETNLDRKAKLNRLPMQAGDVQKTNADITKAKKMVGYTPKTNFQNGIKKFVEWFLRGR